MPAPLSVIPDRFKDFQVPFGPIGKPVYERSYSQVKVDGTKENWLETVVRAVDGNLALVGKDFEEPGERDKLIDLLAEFGMLPAGRHLNASGMLGRQFLFNCHGAGWTPGNPAEHFTFLFDELMQGGGVGGNYSNRYLHTLPIVSSEVDLRIVCRDDHPNINEFAEKVEGKAWFAETLVVEDSREGWVEAVRVLIDAAYRRSMFGTRRLNIDVSNIRPRGAPLKTSGGIACGPEPLVSMLLDLVEILNDCVGEHIDSLDAMYMDHTLASCVIAGGKRRSSRMSVKSWIDDDIFEFINCKSEDGAHWTTNISVEVDNEFFYAYKEKKHPLHKHARKVMRAITFGKQTNGEPGMWNIDKAREGEREPWKVYCPNPCGEIALYMWENCNLGHINLEFFATRPRREAEEAFRLMTRWLIRATFGDIPQPRQREVVDRNRRIGVGFFGYHGWLALRGIRYSDSWHNDEVIHALTMFRAVVDREAELFSKALGIPCPVKTTTLAPTGTIACLPGVSSSAQSIFAAWFKRLVRYSNMDPELQKKKDEGHIWYADKDADQTTIVEFWCEDPLVTKVRAAGWDPEQIIESQDEISFETCLNLQAMLQHVWANNAISFTINQPPEKMPSVLQMEKLLITYMPVLKGTTVFPDESRENAPFQRLTKAQWDEYTGIKQVVQVEDVCKGGCPVG